MSNWLLIDVNNTAHRHYHILKSKAFASTSEVIRKSLNIRFFEDVIRWLERWPDTQMAFCFDGVMGKTTRQSIYPDYKLNREAIAFPHGEIGLRNALAIHLLDLKDELLPMLGCRNVFCDRHFEGDDIIASLCKYSLKGKSTAVIISNDKDMYQLLAPHISVFAGNKTVTANSFMAEWGVKPSMWADIKAIAGCPSDNITGVPGVGEISAAKYLKYELLPDSKKYKAITICGQPIINQNLKLVKLPFAGTPKFKLKRHNWLSRKWKDVAKAVDSESLYRQATGKAAMAL